MDVKGHLGSTGVNKPVQSYNCTCPERKCALSINKTIPHRVTVAVFTEIVITLRKRKEVAPFLDHFIVLGMGVISVKFYVSMISSLFK